MSLIRDWSTLLEGRSAVVTGGGGGVGRAICHQLALAGATVWVNDLDVDRAEEVAKEIAADGGSARAVIGDVCDLDSVRAVRAETGPVDILVNNAGSGIRAVAEGSMVIQPFVDSTVEHWTPVLGVNLYGVIHMTHTYLPSMLERQWGRIVTVVSDAGRKGERGQVIYGAAKAGAMGLTRGLAAEVGRSGVTANCIALGTIPHIVAGEIDPEREKAMRRAYPAGRVGEPEDPAPLAALLCSDAAGWITGQVYPVDGGYAQAL